MEGSDPSLNSNKQNNRRARDAGFWILIIVILISTVYIMMFQPKGEELQYSDIVDLFKEEKVESFTTEGNKLILNLYEKQEDGSKTVTYEMYDFSVFYHDLNDLILQQKEEGILK